MRLEMLGTGSITSKSNSACAIINDNILLDVPNGICKKLYNIDGRIDKIDTCLITHFHGDHYFDLPFLILDKTFKLKENKSFTVIGSIGLERVTKTLNELALPNNWDNVKNNLKPQFIECDNLNKTVINGCIEIMYLKVDHKNCTEACGYIIKDKNHSIGFTGDTSLCESVEYIAKNSDVLVADMSMEKGNDEHMGIDNIIYLAEKYNNTVIIATHMRDETKNKAKNLNIQNVIIPDDGFVYEF
jgi:ribonuclease BN (tRNA processing enzyme)